MNIDPFTKFCPICNSVLIGNTYTYCDMKNFYTNEKNRSIEYSHFSIDYLSNPMIEIIIRKQNKAAIFKFSNVNNLLLNSMHYNANTWHIASIAIPIFKFNSIDNLFQKLSLYSMLS